MHPAGPADPGLPAPVQELFADLRLLKSGAGVQTWVGQRRTDAENVVVKLAELRSVGTAAGMRLAHEAEVLGQMQGPDGRTFLIDHGQDREHIWLAQRYYAGRSLADLLEAGPVGVEATLDIAASVLEQLVVAHARGVVHRDVKPSNIVISDDQPRCAVLVDFGLSRSPKLDPSVRDIPVGTARYCSPEQAGLIDSSADERSDLYSLGLTLYECLAGRPLLEGNRLGDILAAHLAPKPPVREVAPDVPRALSELVARLVRSDPANRYQTAEAVLVDVEQIASARNRGILEPSVVIGSADRRGSLADPGFVGRTAELARLAADMERARRGRGGLVTVEGESGGGKSRLLDELARQATARGVMVLRGFGEDQTASRPFQIFDGVALDLLTQANRDPELPSRLRADLGDRAGTVAAAAPRLVELLGPGETPDRSLPEEYGQARSAAALAALLSGLGRENRPALIILDDCQWAQSLTARVLAEWVASDPSSHSLVVAAFRADEVPLSSPLRSVTALRRIRLSGLSEGDVRDLVASMAGRLPEDAITTIVRLAEGNAFMAQAVLRGMVESGALYPLEGSWFLDPAQAGEIRTSRQAALFLMRRMEALPGPAQILLKAAAIIGKETDLDLALKLSRLPAREAVPALDDLRRRRILWVDEGGRRARFTHDMLRETVLDRLRPADRADLHLEVANFFVSDATQATYQAAYHLDRAGRSQEAFPYAMKAAEAARSRHALEEAEAYYLIAERGAPDARARFTVCDGLGEVLALAGRYADAAGYFQQAAAMAQGADEEAALAGKLGEVAFRRGDVVVACDQLEAALRKLGTYIPKSQAALVLLLLWELLVQAGHSLTGNRLTRHRSGDERDRLKLRFLSRLAYSYWFRNGRVRCLWVHLREMNLAERLGPGPEMAQAYSEHAPVMTMIPWFARGIDYARRSLRLRTQLGDVWGQGQSMSFYGVGLYSASRYRPAIETFEEAVRILNLTGDRWERNVALWHIGLAHYRLGDWNRAAAVAEEVYGEASRIGDHSSAGIALAIWARATSGAAPDPGDIAAAAEQESEDQHTAAELRLAQALQALSSGRTRQACELLSQAWSAIKNAGLRQEYVAPVLPWWATALRAHADYLSGSAGTRGAAETTRAEHRRTAKRAVRMARRYRNNLPHALRELALAEARSGRVRRARRLLDESVGVAAEQEAAWEEATSRYERGRLGEALGWAGWADDVRDGRAAKERIEAGGRGQQPGPPTGETLSLADRFATLLESGRQITAATTATGVFSAVEGAVTGLLRTDRCHVIELADDPEAREWAQAEWPEFVSVSIVREAAATGRIVRRDGAADAEAGDSLVLSGVRSVLCAPILRDGRTVACVYATHSEVAGLFGEAEEQLARFVVALAGAALEHVAGTEAYFRSLIENAHEITVVIDEEANALYVSPSAERILGRTAEQALGRPQWHLIHPADLDRLADRWTEMSHQPAEPSSAEVRFRHNDGSWRWMEVTMANRLDDPSVGGVVLNLRDITERRRAETEAARAAERFRLAFDHAPIGMAIVDQKEEPSGRILLANDALAAMLGRTRAEITGAYMSDFTHSDERASNRRAKDLFRSGQAETAEGELHLRHQDGHWILVRMHAAVIRDESGQPDYFIGQVVDVTEQRAAEEQLLHQALHDPLTGLPNRRMFMERLEAALVRSERTGKHVAVLFLDLDRFKFVNDSFGHEAGDLVLVEAARRLHQLTRTSDTLARLGGDEFVVLVDDLDEVAEAPAIAQRIEDALSRPMVINEQLTVSVTTSIGITIAQGRDTTGFGEGGAGLLRDADTALYRAKERGRARHEVFGDHLRRQAVSRMRVERELRSAIDEDRLSLYYQPVVRLSEGRTVGLEATVHYRRPAGDLVSPPEYMDVAEETGLVVPLGRWSMATAAARLARWREATGLEDLRIAVRVSPRQLARDDLSDAVRAVLDATGIGPAGLALEISEVGLSDVIETKGPVLDRIRELGCTVGIAHFGTGHSSLLRLRRLPFDYVKIDETFVHGLGVNPDDESIVAGIVQLARSLPLGAVATGVETRTQESILIRLGCEVAQGTLYGRPRRADDLLLPRPPGVRIPAPGEGLEPPT